MSEPYQGFEAMRGAFVGVFPALSHARQICRSADKLLVGPYEERPAQIENFAGKVLPLLADLRGE